MEKEAGALQPVEAGPALQPVMYKASASTEPWSSWSWYEAGWKAEDGAGESAWKNSAGGWWDAQAGDAEDGADDSWKARLAIAGRLLLQEEGAGESSWKSSADGCSKAGDADDGAGGSWTSDGWHWSADAWAWKAGDAAWTAAGDGGWKSADVEHAGGWYDKGAMEHDDGGWHDKGADMEHGGGWHDEKSADMTHDDDWHSCNSDGGGWHDQESADTWHDGGWYDQKSADMDAQEDEEKEEKEEADYYAQYNANRGSANKKWHWRPLVQRWGTARAGRYADWYKLMHKAKREGWLEDFHKEHGFKPGGH